MTKRQRLEAAAAAKPAGLETLTITKSVFEDIAKMHKKFKVNKTVASLSEDQLRDYIKFRVSMIKEEYDELEVAFATGDAEGFVDAIIDMLVFAIGTLDVLNVDPQVAWDVVHSSNMKKTPGIKAGRPNPFGFPDLIKPEGWMTPSHEGNHGLLEQLTFGSVILGEPILLNETDSAEA